jgi:hypothetical protein
LARTPVVQVRGFVGELILLGHLRPGRPFVREVRHRQRGAFGVEMRELSYPWVHPTPPKIESARVIL